MPAETERTYPRQARTPFNVTGHPALAMMAGLSSGGLPLSVQFVGRYFGEATLFQVGARLGARRRHRRKASAARLTAVTSATEEEPMSAAPPLDPYRVVAFNTAHDSENKIHDDATARRFGFGGGLVPGVDVYGYMTPPAGHALGPRLARTRHRRMPLLQAGL